MPKKVAGIAWLGAFVPVSGTAARTSGWDQYVAQVNASVKRAKNAARRTNVLRLLAISAGRTRRAGKNLRRRTPTASPPPGFSEITASLSAGPYERNRLLAKTVGYD